MSSSVVSFFWSLDLPSMRFFKLRVPVNVFSVLPHSRRLKSPRSSALTFWTLNYSIFKQWKGRKIYKLTERTLKMTTAQFVEKSVTVNNNSPILDYVHPYDQTQPTLVQYVGENRCPNRFKVCLQQRPSKVTWNYTWNLTHRGWFAPPSINRYRGALSKIENHILWHLIERALPSN